MRATTGSSPTASGPTATGVDVGAVVVAACTGGGLGGIETAGADGVAAGTEIVAVTVDGVTRKAAAAAAADERAASAAASAEEAAAAEKGADAARSRARPTRASTWR